MFWIFGCLWVRRDVLQAAVETMGRTSTRCNETQREWLGVVWTRTWTFSRTKTNDTKPPRPLRPPLKSWRGGEDPAGGESNIALLLRVITQLRKTGGHCVCNYFWVWLKNDPGIAPDGIKTDQRRWCSDRAQTSQPDINPAWTLNTMFELRHSDSADETW